MLLPEKKIAVSIEGMDVLRKKREEKRDFPESRFSKDVNDGLTVKIWTGRALSWKVCLQS